MRGGRLRGGSCGRAGKEELEPRESRWVRLGPADWGMGAGVQAWQSEAGAGKGRDWALGGSGAAAEQEAGTGREAVLGSGRADGMAGSGSRLHCRLAAGW